jgi:hypothetical protein
MHKRDARTRSVTLTTGAVPPSMPKAANPQNQPKTGYTRIYKRNLEEMVENQGNNRKKWILQESAINSVVFSSKSTKMTI